MTRPRAQFSRSSLSSLVLGVRVYIRQSTMQQVRTRLEGQRRQYDLRERAQALGFQHVVVIDEDQGRSGTGSVERPGFGSCVGCIRRVHEGRRQVWAVNEEQTQLFMDAREA